MSTCRPEFAEEKDHTMCKVDSDDVLEHGVSKKEKKIILKYHNKVRRGVQPPATDLAALVSIYFGSDNSDGLCSG